MVHCYVTEKRSEPRMLCADLVRVVYRDGSGKKRTEFANLEDISPSGACIHLPEEVPRGTPVRIVSPRKVLKGRSAWSRRRDRGYYTGLRFEPGIKWNRRIFAPRHLLDPRVLAAKGIARGGSLAVGL